MFRIHLSKDLISSDQPTGSSQPIGPPRCEGQQKPLRNMDLLGEAMKQMIGRQGRASRFSSGDAVLPLHHAQDASLHRGQHCAFLVAALASWRACRGESSSSDPESAVAAASELEILSSALERPCKARVFAFLLALRGFFSLLASRAAR